MKRCFKTMLCLLLVLTMLPVPVRAADSESAPVEDAALLMAVSGVPAAPGGNVTVTVYAPELYTADFVELTYAVPEQLEMLEGDWSWHPAEEAVDFSFVTTTEKATLTLAAPTEISGELLKLVFRVAEDTPDGDYRIPMILVVKNGEEVLCDREMAAEVTVAAACIHELTATPARAATCTAEGNNAYYTCTKCGKVYKDEAAATETTVEAETLAKLPHTYAENWTADAEYHWHKCEDCDAVANKAVHEFEWVIDQEATEDAPGVKHEQCLCGYKRSENTPIDTLPHTHKDITHHEAVAATCTAGGKKEYWTCGECGRLFADEACTTEITEEDLAVSPLAHTLTAVEEVPADCVTDGRKEHWTCGECGKLFADEAGTTEVTEEELILKSEGHVLTAVEEVPSTCETAGTAAHYVCTGCEKLFSDAEGTTEVTAEELALEAAPHSMTKVASKEATCDEAGNIAYWTCDVCKKVFADKNGTIETTQEKVTVEAIGHSYDEGVVTKEPTETENGIRTYTCANCGDVKTEKIPPMGNGNVLRIAGGNRCETAFQAADQLKEVLGVDSFDTIIIASGNSFADALAGSYLAAVKQAPILLYRKGFEEANQEYIAENLTTGGTVYILGGTAAVPKTMDLALDGLKVVRLQGENRYLTNLAILEEAGVDGEEILVATGMEFADCLAASATGLPILMVNSRLDKLTAEQEEFLEANCDKRLTIIGGTSAVSQKLLEQLEPYGIVSRITGERREHTAVSVAEKFYPEAEFAVVAYSRNFPDALCGGPLAYAMGSPLLLVNKGMESYAANYLSERDVDAGFVMGGTNVISNETVRKVFGD